MPCELLLPVAHPLGRAMRKMFWDKGDLGDVRVRAHTPKHIWARNGTLLRPQR